MTEKKKQTCQLLLSILIIVILIPLTVFISWKLGDTHYTIASIIIVILSMVPFFVNFEHQKISASKLVTLAVMTAIAIIARFAFVWLPAFKPMAGVIAITAMCFGPQAGFMSGALSIIVSNLLLGQGPWTPWQMFAYGLIGFICGLLAKGGIISKDHRIRSGILTAVVVTLLSSAILDTSTIFLAIGEAETVSVLAVYISGSYINLLNGVASGICVFFLAKPIYEKIERLKLKYGMD